MAKPRRGEINIDGFEGINELLSPFDLGDLEGNWLVEAENVDIDNGKTVKRRPGTSKIGSYTDPHSLWSDGETALFAAQGTLYRADQINATSISATSLLTGAGPSKFGYAKVHDQIYFSNDKKNGMLLADGSFHNWAVETPSGQPTLSTTTGALNIDHSISVFVTYIDNLGRESGASGVATLKTDSETGVSLTNIPVPSSADIEYKVIYCTPPDGDVFYQVDIIDIATTSYNITNFNHLTIQENTLFLSEPPLGNIIAAESGRILVADGRYLYYSEPLRYHLFKLRENYFEFEDDISIIAAVDGGIYVAADETFFISLAQDVPEKNTVLSYGAIPGTVTPLPEGVIGSGEQGTWVGWTSERGMIFAGPNGQVRNVTEASTRINSAVEGGSLVREDNGYTRMISTARTSGEAAGLRTTDYVEATVTKCRAVSTENTADNYNYTADTTTITADAT